MNGDGAARNFSSRFDVIFRPGDGTMTRMWNEHDIADGEHVRCANDVARFPNADLVFVLRECVVHVEPFSFFRALDLALSNGGDLGHDESLSERPFEDFFSNALPGVKPEGSGNALVADGFRGHHHLFGGVFADETQKVKLHRGGNGPIVFGTERLQTV